MKIIIKYRRLNMNNDSGLLYYFRYEFMTFLTEYILHFIINFILFLDKR